MTLIAASIAVHAEDEVREALDRAQSAAAAGADLIEWRIDLLAEEPDALASVVRLVRDCPKPCIVTCRPQSEGGGYSGDDSSRVSLFEALAASDHPPRYIDVEWATYSRSENLRQKVRLAVLHPRQPRDLQTSLMLSTHDFDRRPADLLQQIEQMTRDDACAVIKIAWNARSVRDNLEAFELLAARRKPTIALCMSASGLGLMSRVLAPKFGGFLTFATDDSGVGTAPGQLSIDQLKRLYRFDDISRSTAVYGVIGWPVEHSRSPHVHNAALGVSGRDAVYVPLPIPPEYEHFKATVASMIDMPGLDFRGASVTIPHKANLVRFVRERGGRIDAISERCGAANTLIVGSAGSVACANTDATAAVMALAEGMPAGRDGLKDNRIAIVGAGGVARAVAAGLLEVGAKVVIFNRNIQRAQQLVEDLQPFAHANDTSIAAGTFDSLSCGCFHAFVNCTPIGMAGGPAPDDSPLPDGVPLNDEVTVMDTVYAPERTPLVAEAQARGARVVFGSTLFLTQAAMQFELWTGQSAPLNVMRRAFASG